MSVAGGASGAHTRKIPCERRRRARPASRLRACADPARAAARAADQQDDVLLVAVLDAGEQEEDEAHHRYCRLLPVEVRDLW